MASRRPPDSPQPSRPARPAAVPIIAKPATQPPAAAVKKTAKKTRTTATRHEPGANSATAAPAVSADERRGMIARAAYLRGERRGFAQGGEAEDWLVAEEEIDALLGGASGAAQ
jgi:hypothetical protein